jgi:hypothetical protein
MYRKRLSLVSGHLIKVRVVKGKEKKLAEEIILKSLLKSVINN